MLIALHSLLWGAIVLSGVFLATSPQLRQALRENWKSLTFVILLAFIWRLPFDGHFYYGLEYEDSYIYSVAARYLASNPPHVDPATSPFLTTVCAVGNWSSCRNPETSSGHFIAYPFMIAVVSKVFGYTSITASWISLAASLATVVFVFLVGKLIDPGGISGTAGALLFSVIPIFAAQGACTYAEPVSNLLVVTCLLICLYMLGPSIQASLSALVITWLALTLTAVLAIAVKRENLLIVPTLLLVGVLFRIDKESIATPSRRLQRLAALLTVFVCAVFALAQLQLLAVIRREQAEYSLFPFSFELWRAMLPMFLKGFLSFSWYFGSAFMVLAAILASLRSQRRTLYALGLFTAYLLLYTSHVRSYYILRGGAITELDTLRYSMNLAGLWAILAGQGLSFLVVRLSRIGLSTSSTAWARRVTWACLAGCILWNWVVTDRLKEDMVANETAIRVRPTEAVLQALQRSGDADTFVISVEPLLIHMLARDPVNVIDFKDLSPELLQDLRTENPNATFFYLEQDIHNSRADRERYQRPFHALDDEQKKLLVRDDHFAVYEIF